MVAYNIRTQANKNHNDPIALRLTLADAPITVGKSDPGYALAKFTVRKE